jgi:hypothetical protein
MSHDFAGASEVDEAAAELILETPVQLLDNGALFEAPLLFFGEFVRGICGFMFALYGFDDSFMRLAPVRWQLMGMRPPSATSQCSLKPRQYCWCPLLLRMLGVALT